jgi:hypothetical protein
VITAWENLKYVRKLCRELDLMTWRDNLVSGLENHFYLVSSSDFDGNPLTFTHKLEEFINKARRREPFNDRVRLAYIGVSAYFY